MFARLVLFNFGPGMRSAADELAGDLAPQIRGLRGCKSVTVFGDDLDGQYGLFVLWDTQEDAGRRGERDRTAASGTPGREGY
ncbi:MAG TPA: hypothetical protein EYM41_02805 [Dehalococcoidia bacterium]|nr:hypothetical protein [Dehalococcoidia bacterium]